MEASAVFEERPAAGIVAAGVIIPNTAVAGIVAVAGTSSGELSEVGAFGQLERFSG